MTAREVLFSLILSFLSVSVPAQVDLWNIELSGTVRDSNGTPIPHVAVTDGYNLVTTGKKGEYRLQSNATAEFVYLTIPSGYKIPEENHAPAYFRRITDKTKRKQTNHFVLDKSEQDDNRHILIACADPQVAFDEEIPLLQEAIDDMQTLVARQYSDLPVHGIVCGDIIAEISREPKFLAPIKQMFSRTRIPFFYSPGNHDMDVGGRSNASSKDTFKKSLGPTYYSFNRGKIHYVILDDVFFTGRGSIGYLEERQLAWLEQDLALLQENTPVVVAFHIPTYSPEARKGEYDKEHPNKVLQNRQALYKILKPYPTLILSGHEHYNENYRLGDTLFEHVQAALCGIFWQAPYNGDGTPLGYTVYEFNGREISWYYKSIGKEKDYQFNAYLPGADKHRPDHLIANVWNYDPQWKVYWYENGTLMGEMTPYRGWDPAIVTYVDRNREHFRYKYVGAGPTEHLFYAEPTDKNTDITIEVIDRFGNIYTGKPE